MKRLNKKTTALLTLSIGLFLGWIIFDSPSQNKIKNEMMNAETTWSCSMHPQIRQNEPGDCPICGMELIPLQNSSEDSDPNAITMSEAAMKLADIQTTIVESQIPLKETALNGKISIDKRHIFSQTSHIPGRIEQLSLDYVGKEIKKGEVITHIYSPELITSQKELLEAYSIRKSSPSLFKAAKEKLKNWKLTEKQINQIIKNGKVLEQFPILSDHTGTVVSKKINLGDHVKEGALLYEITDLSKLWVLFEIYEEDIPWIHINDEVAFAAHSLPEETFKGTISFIDPVIDPKTRVAKARVEITNQGLKLKPEMFVSGIVKSSYSKSKEIIIPKSAVLWTGERSVVYVKTVSSKGVYFSIREVVLGPSLGFSFIIKSGLEEGEEIATNGAFSIDAAAQLAGKPSMMNPKNNEMKMSHNHHNNMKMEHHHNENMEMHNKNNTTEFKHEMFKVFGNCVMCQNRIETAAKSLSGIQTARWDVDTKMLHVSFNPKKVNLEALRKAISKSGHDTESTKAPDEMYDNLPSCCQYERP